MQSNPAMPSAARAARHHFKVLTQLLKYIPRPIVNAAAIEHGIDAKARTFSVFSPMASMIFVQVARTLSHNDVCDWLRLKEPAIDGIGITPPARNKLSHANRNRAAVFIEESSGGRLTISCAANRNSAAGAGPAGGCTGSRRRCTPSTPQPSNWWPTAWTGPSTGRLAEAPRGAETDCEGRAARRAREP